jgi:hypothetical protein
MICRKIKRMLGSSVRAARSPINQPNDIHATQAHRRNLSG